MDAKLEGFVSDQSYAGDVSPKQAWQILEKDSAAVLVDCRTDAEWSWVGLPDLGPLGRSPVCVAWQKFPDMARHDGFLAELESQGLDGINFIAPADRQYEMCDEFAAEVIVRSRS